MALVKPTLAQVIQFGRGVYAEPGALPWERPQDAVLPAPLLVPNLHSWFRADSVIISGSSIVTWIDKAPGSHVTVTQANPAARGSQVTRAGQLAASLDGGDYWQGAFGHSHSQPLTHYIVWEANSTAVATQVMFDGDDAVARHFIFLSSTGPSIRAGATTTLVDGAPSAGQIYASCFVANSPGGALTSALYGLSDFVTAGATGNAGSAAFDGITLGANFSGAGGLAGFLWEEITYVGAHSLATRKILGDYFTARYNGLVVVTS